MRKNRVSDKDGKRVFYKKLAKYFALPYLLLFSMSFFDGDISLIMLIACLIVLYFFLIALVWFIRLLIFLFQVKKINFFKEDKTLVIQFLKK